MDNEAKREFTKTHTSLDKLDKKISEVNKDGTIKELKDMLIKMNRTLLSNSNKLTQLDNKIKKLEHKIK